MAQLKSTTTANQKTENNKLSTFKVFGTRPKNLIFLPEISFGVRNDCRMGRWKLGDSDYKGDKIEISILKVFQYFGDLGKTKNAFWLQIWFVPSPSCKDIPQGTVCVTYLKKRNISQFSQKITQLMESVEPALGIFIGSFVSHKGDKGEYFSVVWDWRERADEAEFKQLDQIVDFLATEPKLIDLSVNLMPVDGLSTEEIQSLIAGKSEQLNSQLTIK